MGEKLWIGRVAERAQDLGFSLAEVAELLQLRRRSPGVCREVQGLAAAKLRSVREKIRQLQGLETVLAGLLAGCRSGDRRPRCAILDAIDEGA